MAVDKKLNEFSLRVMGKHFSDLTREELMDLKTHPGWIPAAYGMSGDEFRATFSPPTPRVSAGPDDPIHQGVDARGRNR